MPAFFIMPEIKKSKKPWIPKKKKTNKSWSFDPRYHTREWRKYRESFLMDNSLCVECKRVGKINAAMVVDHIKPLSQDDSDHNFWNKENHQALCKRCNNRKARTDKLRTNGK